MLGKGSLSPTHFSVLWQNKGASCSGKWYLVFHLGKLHHGWFIYFTLPLMMNGWKGPIGHVHMTSAEGGGGTTDRLMWCNQATLVVHKHTSWSNNSTVSHRIDTNSLVHRECTVCVWFHVGSHIESTQAPPYTNICKPNPFLMKGEWLSPP